MEEQDADIRAGSVINLILGAWLIVSPYILGYTATAAKWNQVILGIVIAVLAILRLLAVRQQWLSFLAGIAGLWAIIAPFILSYNRAAAYWNEVIVGIIVAFLAFYNSTLPATSDRTHHSHA